MENNTRAVYFHDLIKEICSSGLFLAICILTSIAAFLSFTDGGIPVFEVLYAIFFWLLFASAKKGGVSIQNIARVRKVVNAEYIVNWVLVGLLGLSAVSLITLSPVLSNISELLEDYGAGMVDMEEFNEIFNAFADLGISVATNIILGVLGFMILVAGVVLTLYNLFFVKNLKQFAFSVEKSAEFNSFYLQKVILVRKWFLALGIINGVSALSCIDIMSAFLGTGCTATAYILGYLLLKNEFEKFYNGDAEIPATPYYPPYVAEQPMQTPPQATENETVAVVAEETPNTASAEPQITVTEETKDEEND